MKIIIAITLMLAFGITKDLYAYEEMTNCSGEWAKLKGLNKLIIGKKAIHVKSCSDDTYMHEESTSEKLRTRLTEFKCKEGYSKHVVEFNKVIYCHEKSDQVVPYFQNRDLYIFDEEGLIKKSDHSKHHITKARVDSDGIDILTVYSIDTDYFKNGNVAFRRIIENGIMTDTRFDPSGSIVELRTRLLSGRIGGSYAPEVDCTRNRMQKDEYDLNLKRDVDLNVETIDPGMTLETRTCPKDELRTVNKELNAVECLIAKEGVIYENTFAYKKDSGKLWLHIFTKRVKGYTIYKEQMLYKENEKVRSVWANGLQSHQIYNESEVLMRRRLGSTNFSEDRDEIDCRNQSRRRRNGFHYRPYSSTINQHNKGSRVRQK